ncbi:MAG: DEAD/DEAH box helicase, partial [Gammaproteobacteria bacterium]|nr:DEAD/DEAH box helicase [Gammaproteobacteria bacterium]
TRFTNLIAEPDADEERIADAVNDTLKAISASLLMEQVLAPKFKFSQKTKESAPEAGFDYGETGYDSKGSNVGVNTTSGEIQIEIKGLQAPKSESAKRVCQEDLNEVVTAFVQDKPSVERGLFDKETLPEELTIVRMGKIVKERYPEMDQEDQEAIRQHAVAALNLTQQAKKAINLPTKTDNNSNASNASNDNKAFIHGVRKFVTDVTELDIDLLDSINPFNEAYSILAKAINEDSLKRVEAIIAAKRINLSLEEARELALRALAFKKDRGRLPSLTSSDGWEKRMAEGVSVLQQKTMEQQRG